MKKYICILAGACLLAACEQKTETVAPAVSPTPTTTPEAEATVPEPMSSVPAETTESPTATPMDTSQTGSWVSPTPTP